VANKAADEIVSAVNEMGADAFIVAPGDTA